MHGKHFTPAQVGHSQPCSAPVTAAITFLRGSFVNGFISIQLFLLLAHLLVIKYGEIENKKCKWPQRSLQPCTCLNFPQKGVFHPRPGDSAGTEAAMKSPLHIPWMENGRERNYEG